MSLSEREIRWLLQTSRYLLLVSRIHEIVRMPYRMIRYGIQFVLAAQRASDSLSPQSYCRSENETYCRFANESGSVSVSRTRTASMTVLENACVMQLKMAILTG